MATCRRTQAEHFNNADHNDAGQYVHGSGAHRLLRAVHQRKLHLQRDVANAIERGKDTASCKLLAGSHARESHRCVVKHRVWDSLCCTHACTKPDTWKDVPGSEQTRLRTSVSREAVWQRNMGTDYGRAICSGNGNERELQWHRCGGGTAHVVTL